MQTKHFVSDPANLVLSSLEAVTLTNPSVALSKESKIIYRRIPKTEPKVSIVSGGGSGHEPGFAGFVGKGFLTASVAGSIFASPSAEQVRQAVAHVPTGKGILFLIMNYTGDVLNFGMTTEKTKAAGIPTEFLAVGDDVGVPRAKGGKVGRRGLAGTVIVMKIAGALAEAGGSLSEVHKVAEQVASNMATVGASLDYVNVPGRPVDEEASGPGDGEVELGLGIHNEPGAGRIKATLPDLVSAMLGQLLDPNDAERHFVDFKSSDEVILAINNLGGISNLELGSIVTEVVHQLGDKHGILPIRVISGAFLTSLNGPGFSVTLVRTQGTGLGAGKSMVELLDAPAEAAGWGPMSRNCWESWRLHHVPDTEKQSEQSLELPPSHLTLDPEVAIQALKAGLLSVIAAEPEVTKYDSVVGDGDCGLCLKNGAEAIAKILPDMETCPDAVAFVNKIVSVVETAMDGTSGALYTIFLSALAQGLRNQDPTCPTAVNVQIWSEALQHSLRTLTKYTPAVPGDRTLIDSLVPFVHVLSQTGDVTKASSAAADGSEATKVMEAKLGRSVYVGAQSEWIGKVPDPGAWGLSKFLGGLTSELQ